MNNLKVNVPTMEELNQTRVELKEKMDKVEYKINNIKQISKRLDIAEFIVLLAYVVIGMSMVIIFGIGLIEKNIDIAFTVTIIVGMIYFAKWYIQNEFFDKELYEQNELFEDYGDELGDTNFLCAIANKEVKLIKAVVDRESKLLEATYEILETNEVESEVISIRGFTYKTLRKDTAANEINFITKTITTKYEE